MAANQMQSPRGMLCLPRLQEQPGSGVSIRRTVEAAHLPSKQKMSDFCCISLSCTSRCLYGVLWSNISPALINDHRVRSKRQRLKGLFLQSSVSQGGCSRSLQDQCPCFCEQFLRRRLLLNVKVIDVQIVRLSRLRVCARVNRAAYCGDVRSCVRAGSLGASARCRVRPGTQRSGEHAKR